MENINSDLLYELLSEIPEKQFIEFKTHVSSKVDIYKLVETFEKSKKNVSDKAIKALLTDFPLDDYD